MDSNAKIESVPEEVIKAAIASFSPISTYCLHSFVDLYDTNTWRVGIVTQVQDNCIDVHFEGWAPKYDEKNVKVTEFRVEPFRKYTRGYTGQVKSTYRVFAYSSEERKEMERRLRETVEKRFVEEALEFTRFFRGELFFFVDSLLTSLAVSPPSAELVPEILLFLDSTLNAMIEWMKVSWELREEMEAGEKWDLLYAVHGRTAAAVAHAEVAETLRKLFGESARATTTLLVIYSNRQGVPSNEPLNARKATEWFAKRYYLKFKEFGGTNEILRMVEG
eukprot:TRINITY_DN2577_c0_g7_i1.p1 TRINITY_DN2577_c0_g7~~TRINITY_DN2577_c0_g7_i1.p1  ORF type:complete len:277 (-),score=78.87 TRINITY_DN2577_c0_g7_i1:697-1527(-)